MRKLLFVALIVPLAVMAQDIPTDTEKTVLTLEECIEIALENNIQLKQAMNGLELAQANKKQSYFNFAPSLNGRLNYDIDQGPNFDEQTGQFVTATTNTSNPYLAADLTIFNGLNNYFFLNQRIQEHTSAENAAEAQKLNVISLVIANYLNVIVDRENVKISEQRLELLEGQYEREQRRESIGVGNMETVLNFKAQAANERLNLVNLTNQYRSDLLILLQVLQIHDVLNYTVADFEISEEDLLIEVDPYDQVADEIIAYSFSIKRAEADQQAALYRLKRAKSLYYPSLNAQAYLGSRFSSNNAGLDYMEQINQNQVQGIGIALNVPIFNRLSAINQVQQAKIGYVNSELANKQALLDVTNGIQRNYLDLISARTAYLTAHETQDASNQTFEFVKKRFDTGNTDFYTYLESLNNKNRADTQLVNARYSMVLRNKILNLYRGKSS